jgi:hypothetical protein
MKRLAGKNKAKKEPEKVIGTVPVWFTGKAIYFAMNGGSFNKDGVKGTFATGGASIVVYIDGGSSYVCDAKDVIEAAIADHKKNRTG